MTKFVKKEIEWIGKKLILETGEIACQSNAAIIAKYGDTTILCTLNFKKEVNDDVDFLPLTVHYQEKFYAAGKIPGGFRKREAGLSERETLISRLIDRSIRPLFPKNFKNETQIICTVLSYDQEVDSDILAIIATSAAMLTSSIPFEETIAAIKIAFNNDEVIPQPLISELEDSKLDLIMAATRNSILMVESEIKELSNNQVLDSMQVAKEFLVPVFDMLEEFSKEVNKTKIVIEATSKDILNLYKPIKDFIFEDVIKHYQNAEKTIRKNAISLLRKETIVKFLTEENIAKNISEANISAIFDDIEKEAIRTKMFETSKRIDGRAFDEVRDIKVKVGFLPKVHGSALFTRGETQALVITTLGAPDEGQMVNGLKHNYNEHFMLHYNFPPYSVGEVSMLRGSSRREIGHGKLAFKSIYNQLPSKDEFRLVTRIVSEVTSSNGSSSMATVCGSSLSLMDAGVPIKNQVAGIAMGLIIDKDNVDNPIILSDIMGEEDHLGDMDFKVAGTKNGLTALQMDIKVNGITFDILKKSLYQAENGLTHILGKMNEVISESNKEFKKDAPAIDTVKIYYEKIKDLIGAGGKTIKQISEISKSKIEVSDSGVVTIVSPSREYLKIAKEKINLAVEGAKVGVIYDGEILSIVDFGAFVKFLDNQVALIHISEFSDGHVSSLKGIVEVNDKVKFKIIGKDFKGKLRLSYKDVDQKTGEDLNPNRVFNPKDTRSSGNNGDSYKKKSDISKKRQNASNSTYNKSKKFRNPIASTTVPYYDAPNEDSDIKDSKKKNSKLLFWKK